MFGDERLFGKCKKSFIYKGFLKGLVVCAVWCEPVSTAGFPVIREFNREIRDFGLFEHQTARNYPVPSGT
jgi:hypothetical protein